MGKYAEHDLRKVFFEALDMFNECLDSDITRENTILAFFTPDDGMEVYERLCREYFPQNLREDYKAEGYFETFAAQAFVGAGHYGVMIRSDLDFQLEELNRVFLHEISHLFCTQNEIEGGNYFDRYCMGSGVEDGMMNAGYAIWREAVADIMADSVLSEYTSLSLEDVRKEVRQLYAQLSPANPDAKKCMSLIIVFIILTREVAGATEWANVEPKCSRRANLSRNRRGKMTEAPG